MTTVTVDWGVTIEEDGNPVPDVMVFLDSPDRDSSTSISISVDEALVLESELRQVLASIEQFEQKQGLPLR